MKKLKKLKVILIILLILLFSLISFLGVFIKNKSKYENIVTDYSLGMDLKGGRLVQIKVDDSKESVIKDSNGKTIESATDEEIQKNGYTKIETPVNKQEELNVDNFEKSKKIIENRLKNLKFDDYTIRLNRNNGNISVQLQDNLNTDTVISTLYPTGNFEIQDADTKEVLMNNDDLEKSSVLYSNNNSGTTVYLSIKFKNDSKSKLEKISEKYVSSKDQSGNTTEKKIKLLLDGEELISTSFSEKISTGELQLSIGNSATSSDKIQEGMKKAEFITTLLNNGKMPIKYTIDGSKYIQSEIKQKDINIFLIVIASIVAIGLMYFMIRYKKQGILVSISYIGLIAVTLLAIRYANVKIDINGLYGIILIMIINYIFSIMLLNKLKTNEDIKKAIKQTIIRYVFILIPIYIIAIVFCFISYLPVSSLGMIMFWGISIILIYNIIFTRILLVNSIKDR